MHIPNHRRSVIHANRLAYGAAIAAMVMMGSLGIFVRNISADAAMIAFARFGLGFVFLVGLLAVTRSLEALKIPISPSLIASGLSIGVCVWSYIEAIAHTSLATAAFLLYWVRSWLLALPISF